MNNLRIEGLAKSFTDGRQVHHVLDELDLTIPLGQIVGLVGRSGCGKSTLARILVGLETADQGRILLPDDTDLLSLKRKELRQLRPKLQLVFQDPYSAFDANHRVGMSFRRFLRTNANTGPEQTAVLASAMESVGLQTEHLTRYPAQLSGGQLQRIALARAMLADPTVLVADEIVSALDMVATNQILSLIQNFRAKQRAIILISHDLGVILRYCDYVAVMDTGRIVEFETVETMAKTQQQPITRKLFEAVPQMPSGKA